MSKLTIVGILMVAVCLLATRISARASKKTIRTGHDEIGSCDFHSAQLAISCNNSAILCPVAANLTELNIDQYKAYAVAGKRLGPIGDGSWAHFTLLPNDTSGWHSVPAVGAPALELFANGSMVPSHNHTGIAVLNTTCFDSMYKYFRTFRPELATVVDVPRRVPIYAVINVD